MFLLFKLLLFVLCAQHVIGEPKILFDNQTKKSDDLYVLTDIIKYYIARIRGDNRRLVLIKFAAASANQNQRQMDLLDMLMVATSQLHAAFMFLDLKLFPNHLIEYRGLNILFMDNSDAIR